MKSPLDHSHIFARSLFPSLWGAWLAMENIIIIGRYWDMVERLKINQFYTAPTAIRLLIKSGDEHVLKYDLSSLRVLGSVGEPINPEAWNWYNEVCSN